MTASRTASFLRENLACLAEAQRHAGVNRWPEGKGRAPEALAGVVGDRSDRVRCQLEVDGTPIALNVRQRLRAKTRGRFGVGHRTVGIDDHHYWLAAWLGVEPGRADRHERRNAEDPHAASLHPSGKHGRHCGSRGWVRFEGLGAPYSRRRRKSRRAAFVRQDATPSGCDGSTSMRVPILLPLRS